MRGLIQTVDRPVSFTMENGSPDQRVEPITIELAKKHTRFASSTEDDLFAIWIAAARMHFEEQTGRQLVNAVYEYALDRPPVARKIEIPRPPLVGVISVTYDDASGVEQALDPAMYRVLSSVLLEGSPEAGVVDPYAPCGFIELVSGASWPTTRNQSRALRIRRTCGYGTTPAEMPELVRGALLFLVGHFHRNRSETTEAALSKIPLGASLLLNGFRDTALQTFPPREFC